ncbi:hypothetical protein Tola_1310 [Tolumonas auensis DSM 9187]|uniref:Uncharacterized protein n=1 Tax=Tolumonas auensis (strain DSM 9187 / NBRC 110442 / TA 4) TaxID=595494 RepID=C4LEA6_TOLAT|nr:hypothetical protein [Tolumonas auensis]ACQ92927.1 hypothetical protein Tola_1310 [Tolumonas auensis DSM 9187]
MGAREYHLYRAKFIKPAQLPLFVDNKSSMELFLNSINDKPNYTRSSGSQWHLGNVKMFGDYSGSFAVGRTTKTTFEKFDKETGDFVDELDDSAPYTVVIFDAKIGLLGIAKKSKLAPNASSIARRIKDLFLTTKTAIEAEIDVRVDVIPDPEDFLDKLRGAYSIRKFRATFTGPNPIDADELFQKPLSVYAQSMGASSGILEVVGEALNENVAESVAKSTAATGNTASARVVPSKGVKAKNIKMKGDAVVVTVDEDASNSQVLEQMQVEYMRVRG